MESCCIWSAHQHLIQSHHRFIGFSNHKNQLVHLLAANGPRKCNTRSSRIFCTYEDPVRKPPQPSPSSSSSSSSAIQLYNQIERFNPQHLYQWFSWKPTKEKSQLCYFFLIGFCRLLTETSRQSQDYWGGSNDWSEVEVLFLSLSLLIQFMPCLFSCFPCP